MTGILCRGQPEDWPEVEPLIETALAHNDGEMTAFDVRRFLDSGDMQLWVAKADDYVIAAAVTQVVNYPRKSALRVVILAGDGFPQWVDMGMRMFGDFARQYGCSFIEMDGREGWKRKLKDWKLSTIRMRLPLEGDHAPGK